MKRFHVLRDLIKKNNYKTFVEVGVAEGITSKFLLDNILDLRVFCIDPYEVYPGYRGSHHGSAKKLFKKYEWAKENVFNHERCKFYKTYSGEAVKLFKIESIDIVFIDGNHFYEWVKKDIDWWYPIVRKGGILSGHDYVSRNKWGVVKAVNAFVKKNKLELNLEDDRVWWFYK